MIDVRILDELSQRLGALLPPSLDEARGDLQKNFRAALQAGLAKLDLVTREEFEVQQQVLRRTRELLETLEARLTALEQGADGT